jgi:hypothetical protein
VALTLEQANSLLARRDETFVACNLDGYLDIWAEHCRVEGPEHLIKGRKELRESVEAAWKTWEPLLMCGFSVSVTGNLMYHEFASLWERRGQTERRLVTGMSVSEVDRSGRWVWLREYFDPASARRASTLARPEIARFLADEQKSSSDEDAPESGD